MLTVQWALEHNDKGFAFMAISPGVSFNSTTQRTPFIIRYTRYLWGHLPHLVRIAWNLFYLSASQCVLIDAIV